MTIKISGVKAIESKITTRLNRMVNRRNYIFMDPLQPTIKEIRKNLVKDTINTGLSGRKNHIFTGRLFNSTESRLKSFSHAGGFDFDMELQFGYFVDYGLDLELCLLYTSPSPRDRTRSRMPSSA